MDRIQWQTFDDVEAETEPHTIETELFFCTADRIAFERQFQTPAGRIVELRETNAREIPEEWIAFFVWRVVNRARPADFAGFEDFLDRAAFARATPARADGEDPEAPDPTAAAESSQEAPQPA